MDISTRAAPPPGSAQAGDLYVDLQSRTLWLGVDPVVDPTQFVLISDIVALQNEIEGSLVEAKAYTDTQITTRAPTVHTHTSTQITDFNAAVTAVASSIPALAWVKGMILMWSGSIAEIGTGGLAGWTLCDGSNGSPDLRDRFVLGAGSRVVGSLNPQSALNFSGGIHDHGINYHALTLAEMPYHGHAGNTGYMSHDHAHYTSGGTDGQGQHSHAYAGPGTQSATGGVRPTGSGGTNYGLGTDAQGHHAHNWANWSGGCNSNHYHGMNYEGSNHGHTHTIVGGGGSHDHSIPATNIREAIPFYALAFIMKL